MRLSHLMMKVLNAPRFLVCGLLALGLLFDPEKALAESVEPLGFEFAFTIGASTGPFKTDTDFYIGGALDLPIFSRSGPILGYKFMGEIMVGWTRSSADITSVSPLVVVGAPAAAVTSDEFHVTTTQVLVGAKYKLDKLGEPGSLLRRIQPYVVAGVGFNVMLGKTKGSPLGDFIGGAAPQPPELQQLGFPAGQGNVLIGGNFGGGIDFLLTNRILIGAEFRWNVVERSHSDFGTFGGKLGFRF